MRRIDSRKSAAIALVEAAYSLPADESAWLEGVLEAAVPVMGNAVFASGIIYNRPPGARSARVQTWKHVGASDHMERAAREYATKVPTDVERLWLRIGTANTVSQISPESRQLCRSFAAKTGEAADALLLNAREPDGRGASVAMFLPVETQLKPDERERWRKLGAHLTAGHRVWRGVTSMKRDPTALPCGAEAVLDPTMYRVVDAAGSGKDRDVVEKLRDSARRIDHARGRLRKTDPAEALETWRALVRGRWSMLDWFDSDGRRFVLGMRAPSGDLRRPRRKRKADRLPTRRLEGNGLGRARWSHAQVGCQDTTPARREDARLRPTVQRHERGQTQLGDLCLGLAKIAARHPKIVREAAGRKPPSATGGGGTNPQQTPGSPR